MVAFYCASNLGILNAINVKQMYYRDDKADLFIRFVGGTSYALVEAADESRVFENVFCINYPTVDETRGIMKRSSLVRALLNGKKIQEFVNRYLDVLVKDKKYDTFLTLHMDAQAVHYAHYFRRSNKKLRIEFLEDGNASYLRTKKYLTHSIKGDMKWKRFLLKKMSEVCFYWRVRSNVTDRLYIYNPDQYDLKKGFTPMPLKMQTESTAVLERMAKKLDSSLILLYKKKMAVYIANEKTSAEPTYDFAYGIIESIIDVVGTSLIVKTHSNASTENREHFGEKFESKVYVDREVYLFESLICEIPDWSDKIVVMRASASAMLFKSWFDTEPYVILTFRLFPYYGEHGDPGGDEYVEILQEIYSDPNRIMVPNTMGEFEYMLKKCKKEIYKKHIKEEGGGSCINEFGK